MGPSAGSKLIEDLETASAEQRAAVSDGHASVRDAIREIQAALSDLESREAALAESTTLLGSQTHERLKSVQTALQESNAARDAAKNELKAAHARIGQLDEHAGNAPALKEQIAALEDKCDTLQAEVDRQSELLIDAETAHKRLRKLEQAYKEQAEALQSGQAARRRAAELETTINEYKQAMQAEQKAVTELRGKLSEGEARESELAERIQALESQDVQAVADELEQCRKQLSEAAHRTETLEADLAHATKEAERIEKNVQELDEEVALRGQALQEAEQERARLEDECARLKNELDEVRSHARDTAESERALRADLDDAQLKAFAAEGATGRVAELEGELEPLRAELTKAKSHSAKLEQDLKRERARPTNAQLAAQLAQALEAKEAAEAALQSVSHGEGSAENPALLDSPGEDDALSFGSEDAAMQDARGLLGEIFVSAGVISAEQLDRALAVQQSERPVRRLGEILVSLGHTKELDVAQAVARQQGLKFLKLDAGSIDTEAAHLIGGRLAEMHMCIPVREQNDELIVAMENPLDLIAIEDVERASDRRVRPAVATISAIQAAISRVYAKDRQRA